jgi:DNA-binding GntR family transcriptional regulator
LYRATTRLAAQRHRPEEIGEIRALQAKFAAAVDARDALGMIATNYEFHLRIARAGRNRYYTDLFTRLLDEGRRILRLYYLSFNDELPRQYVIEHEDMISAIVARDVERADLLGKLHADQIVRQIQHYITADTRPTDVMTL